MFFALGHNTVGKYFRRELTLLSDYLLGLGDESRDAKVARLQVCFVFCPPFARRRRGKVNGGAGGDPSCGALLLDGPGIFEITIGPAGTADSLLRGQHDFCGILQLIGHLSLRHKACIEANDVKLLPCLIYRVFNALGHGLFS